MPIELDQTNRRTTCNDKVHLIHGGDDGQVNRVILISCSPLQPIISYHLDLVHIECGLVKRTQTRYTFETSLSVCRWIAKQLDEWSQFRTHSLPLRIDSLFIGVLMCCCFTASELKKATGCFHGGPAIRKGSQELSAYGYDVTSRRNKNTTLQLFVAFCDSIL